MKRILLLTCTVLIAGGLFAQNLSLIFEGNPIAHGSTVQVMGDPTDEYIQARVDVKNNASTAIEVKVKKIIAAGDTLPGTNNYFCWGVCFLPTIYTSPNFITIEPDQVNNEFYGDYNPYAVIGISRITYVFFDQNNVNDSVAVKVEYNASPASIGEGFSSGYKISEAYPNPAINTVNMDYSLPGDVRKASIVITNMLGSRVKEITLTDLNGKISIPVNDLVNGIYFHSLLLDDKPVLTRKFVVKR